LASWWYAAAYLRGWLTAGALSERDPALASPAAHLATHCPRPQAESLAARDFLRAHGVVLGKRSQCGAHSVARTHRNEPPGPNVGNVLIRALADAVHADAGIEVRTSTRARALLTAREGEPCPDRAMPEGEAPDDVRVCGVTLSIAGAPGADEQLVELRARAVVLATGGFAASAAHVQRWAPALAALPTTNGETASGEGIELAVRAGAALVDMPHVQVHPTALVNRSAPDQRTLWLAPEALRAAGGVLVAYSSGTRFVDELGTRAAVTAAIRALPGARAALVLGEAAARSFGVSALRFYATQGFAYELSVGAGAGAAQAARALAEHIGVDADALERSLADYDALAARAAAGEANVRDAFGKKVFPAPVLAHSPTPPGGQAAEPPAGTLFVLEVTPALHYCMGGVRIGERAQVLSAASGEPIGGLYAAGEVTGGVHGANRLAGNSLLECVVFGRTAGKAAALEPVRVDAGIGGMGSAGGAGS